MTTAAATPPLPFLATTHNRNIVLVFGDDGQTTHYLGIEGCQLSVLAMPSRDFAHNFVPWLSKTPTEFAVSYTSSAKNSCLIPVSGHAYRVLKAILDGQTENLLTYSQPQPEPERTKMAEAKTPRDTSNGPVAKIHEFLNKKIDAIRAQTISRKELIDQLVAKGYNASTITTQCGVWARANEIVFARPSQAEEAKKAASAEKRTSKKAAATAAA